MSEVERFCIHMVVPNVSSEVVWLARDSVERAFGLEKPLKGSASQVLAQKLLIFLDSEGSTMSRARTLSHTESEGDNLMHALASNLATVPAISEPSRITTTLYDLVAALNTEVAPEDDHLVTAAVMHLINTGHTRFVGSRKQVKIVEA